MGHTKAAKMFAAAMLSLSLLTTSFGGAIASVAYAAQAESDIAVQEEKASDNQALVGLAALALVAVMSKKSSSAATKEPAKTPAPSPAPTPVPSSPPVSQPPTTSAPPTSTPAPDYGSVSSSGLTAAEQQAVTLMNADRNANGLPSLKVNTKLVALAERYAQDMINRGYFSHYDPEGRSPFDRMQQAGIMYRTAGENLAINSSVAAAEKAFMNSSGHRANILNSTYTEVGIGVKYAANGQVYVVQEFIGK